MQASQAQTSQMAEVFVRRVKESSTSFTYLLNPL